MKEERIEGRKKESTRIILAIVDFFPGRNGGKPALSAVIDSRQVRW